MIIGKMTARKPGAIMMTTSMLILPIKGNENITMALKLTRTAPTTMTQEMMKMMMTKIAVIADKVKKEEVMMTKQC